MEFLGWLFLNATRSGYGQTPGRPQALLQRRMRHRVEDGLVPPRSRAWDLYQVSVILYPLRARVQAF